MKKVILTVTAIIFSLKLMAQAPEKMSYQAVVRNSSNGLVISAPVGMRISILQGSASGAAVYTETHTVNSNANGLVSLEIGSGTVVSGNFSTIDWSADTYFIQTETDPTGGTTYTVTGTSQLMSVPYALHAKTAETAMNGIPAGTANGQTAHWNGTSWVVDNSLTNNGSNVSIGTTNAPSKLNVAGSVEFTGGFTTPSGIMMEEAGGTLINLSNNFREPDKIDTLKGGAIRIDGRNGFPTVQFLTRPAGSNVESTPMVIAENNNVGIGTTSPNKRLQVVGSSDINGTHFINTSSASSSTENQIPISSGAIANVIFYTPCSDAAVAAVLFIEVNGTVKIMSQTGTGVNALSGSGTNTITLTNGCGQSIPYTFTVSGGIATISYPSPIFTSARWVVTPI